MKLVTFKSGNSTITVNPEHCTVQHYPNGAVEVCTPAGRWGVEESFEEVVRILEGPSFERAAREAIEQERLNRLGPESAVRGLMPPIPGTHRAGEPQGGDRCTVCGVTGGGCLLSMLSGDEGGAVCPYPDGRQPDSPPEATFEQHDIGCTFLVGGECNC